MLLTFKVENFRGFHDLAIGPLDRVNLISGKNNTGKTSLLEAIYLHLNPANQEAVVNISRSRGIEGATGDFLDVCGWLFPEKNVSSSIVLTSEDSEGINPSTTMHYIPIETAREQFPEVAEKFMSLVFVPPGQSILLVQYRDSNEGKGYFCRVDLKRNPSYSYFDNIPQMPPSRLLTLGSWREGMEIDDFSTLEMDQRQDEILPSLQILEPRLRRLSLAKLADQPAIFGNVGPRRLLPVTFMGEGMKRLLTIVLAIANCPGGVVLIDEVENGLHHSILRKVWEAIGQMARRVDTQVFATTHSYECIEAAHEAFSGGDPYDLRLHRLDRIGDRIKAVTYDRGNLTTSVEMALEVR